MYNLRALSHRKWSRYRPQCERSASNAVMSLKMQCSCDGLHLFSHTEPSTRSMFSSSHLITGVPILFFLFFMPPFLPWLSLFKSIEFVSAYIFDTVWKEVHGSADLSKVATVFLSQLTFLTARLHATIAFQSQCWQRGRSALVCNRSHSSGRTICGASDSLFIALLVSVWLV